jgi:hypothetical protein
MVPESPVQPSPNHAAISFRTKRHIHIHLVSPRVSPRRLPPQLHAAEILSKFPAPPSPPSRAGTLSQLPRPTARAPRRRGERSQSPSRLQIPIPRGGGARAADGARGGAQGVARRPRRPAPVQWRRGTILPPFSSQLQKPFRVHPGAHSLRVVGWCSGCLGAREDGEVGGRGNLPGTCACLRYTQNAGFSALRGQVLTALWGQEGAGGLENYCSITIDGSGGLSEDILQQRLQSIVRQREELQQVEIELRAQALVRPQIIEAQRSFQAATKEHGTAAAKLKVASSSFS